MKLKLVFEVFNGLLLIDDFREKSYSALHRLLLRSISVVFYLTKLQYFLTVLLQKNCTL